MYGSTYFIEYTRPCIPMKEMIRAKIFTDELDPSTGKKIDIVLFVERSITDGSYMFSADIGKEFPCIIGHNPDILAGKVDDSIIDIIICENPEEIFPALLASEDAVYAFETKLTRAQLTEAQQKVVCGHDFMITCECPGEPVDDVIGMPTSVLALDYIFGRTTFDEMYTCACRLV